MTDRFYHPEENEETKDVNRSFGEEITENGFEERYTAKDDEPVASADGFEETQTPGDYEDISSTGGFEAEASANSFDDGFTEPEVTTAAGEATGESSYEWNADSDRRDSEYHYSYINGNNSGAAHNPNNYEDAYSASGSRQDGYYGSGYPSSNPYSSNYGYGAGDNTQVYNYGAAAQTPQQPAQQQKKKRERKPAKSASRGFVVAAVAIAMAVTTAAGIGGGYLIGQQLNGGGASSTGGMTIKQVAAGQNSDGSVEDETIVTAGTTSNIVKKTANSVVEIATEINQRSSLFSQGYKAQGAGSGVIISDDGYIVTNHHVIDGASKITVTLRDGSTAYDAKLIGTDEDNDIALLKIDATGLTAATFGNSSNLEVGDYVVAIGNPLGTLGGTVTDGIISALAREVTIENKNLTLLQTNAQISPGNSGGGLFNANGELVGIVNAKDSATEVEGIAFAIPVNKVVDIIKDLKDYGYVTGKISTGMQFVDIQSQGTAFYYNVNDPGVYVLSVDKGSNAEKAGFVTGDMITAVNGTEVSTQADIEKALENNKVGDVVTFTIKQRGGKTQDISLELSEYVPSVKPNDDEETQNEFQSNDMWDQFLNW